jgi:long-subunit acyl-CoA synthetase (AMP-forming)
MTSEVSCPHPSGTSVRTLCEGFQLTAALDPDRVAIRTVGDAQRITWREYADRVRKIAAGLAARGVGHGDTVALMLTNRPEYELVDTAALHLGAIPFSIYNTSSPEQVNYLFGNAGNRIVVTERQFIGRVAAAGTAVETIVCIDGPAEGAITLDELEAGGAADFDFEAAWRATTPEDVVTLIYTSGTTGPPKGVEITNTNVMAQVAATLEIIEVNPGDQIVSYLPAAHIADRVASHYIGILRGAEITCVDDPREVGAALVDVRPTMFFGVPRVWQKIKAGIEARIAAEPKTAKRKIATWAIEVGRQVAARRLADQRVPATLAMRHGLADRLVLAKLRHAIGMDRMQWAASGAAAIPPETIVFFNGIGVAVYEIWGMSEITGCGTSNTPGRMRLGSVGQAIAGLELRLAEDGELLCRGTLTMRGYRRDPERTAEAVDADGWLHTGDIAKIDEDGYVTIVDRKKELIITEAGKNMSPTNIENAVKAASPLVGQAFAVGDSRPYVTALIVLDPEVAAAVAGAAAPPAALAENDQLRAVVREAVITGNARLSRAEQIKRFRILSSQWEPGGDELTPTMKLKRRPICDKYASEIDELYAPSPGPQVVDLHV